MRTVLLISFLALSMEIVPSPAVSPVDHYELKGGSVRLTVEGLQTQTFKRFNWKVNTTDLLEYSQGITMDYYSSFSTEKMKFNTTDLSLLIMDLEESDTENYTAVVYNDGKFIAKAMYRLIVQEAVPTPDLRVIPGGFCNVSVNCSSKDSWVSHTCDLYRCTQIENITGSGVNLTVMSNHGIIVCRSSNRVSSKNHSKPMGPGCTDKKSQPLLPNSNRYLVVGFSILFGISIFLPVIVVYFKKRRASQTPDAGQNTVYAIPQEKSRPDTQRPQSNNTCSDADKIISLYCTVQASGSPPSQTEDPKSIYSVVKK